MTLSAATVDLQSSDGADGLCQGRGAAPEHPDVDDNVQHMAEQESSRTVAGVAADRVTNVSLQNRTRGGRSRSPGPPGKRLQCQDAKPDVEGVLQGQRHTAEGGPMANGGSQRCAWQGPEQSSTAGAGPPLPRGLAAANGDAPEDRYVDTTEGGSQGGRHQRNHQAGPSDTSPDSPGFKASPRRRWPGSGTADRSRSRSRSRSHEGGSGRDDSRDESVSPNSRSTRSTRSGSGSEKVRSSKHKSSQGDGHKGSHRERHRDRDRDRDGERRRGSRDEEGDDGRSRDRDRPEAARSRSRSRSRSPVRDRSRERKDRDRRRDRDADRDKGASEARRSLQGREGSKGADGADGDLHRERRRSSDGGRDARPAAVAALARGPASGAATLPKGAPAAAPQPPHAVRPGGGVVASRPLVSFSDELDEEGGLGGGGSGGVKATGAAPSGTTGGLTGLAASTAMRFLREESAQQRLAIPPRTITTTTTSSAGVGLGSLPGPLSFLGGLMGQRHAPFHTQPQHSQLSSPFGSAPLPAPPPLGPVAAAASALAKAAEAATTAVAGALAGASRRSSSPPPVVEGRTLGRMLFGMASARCARPYMEDRHCIVQCLRPLSSSGQPLQDGVQRSLAAIYDGHNGTRAADTAAARLHMLLAADAALRTHTGELGPPAAMAAEEAAISGALRRCFRRLDDEILAEARADGARDGATALLVMRLSDTLYAAHAGDSRAVLSRRGTALRLTEDHKPNLPAERARVEAAGGRVDFQRCWRVIVEPRDGRLGSGLAVSRSLGDLDFKEPQRFVECEPSVGRLVPQPGDNLVVLGSDGLWDVMSDQEAVDVANGAMQARYGGRQGPPAAYRDEDAKAVAEALLEAAVRRGTADNVTVIVMLLQWD